MEHDEGRVCAPESSCDDQQQRLHNVSQWSRLSQRG